MVTMATKNVTVKAEYTLINSVGIWVYEYDVHSVMTFVHLIEVLGYLECVISTQIQPCFALTTRDPRFSFIYGEHIVMFCTFMYCQVVVF